MGWRYRKRVKIAPGIHLNFSKSGISTTIGPRGASINIGPKGTYVNTGIPGTGLYNREKISSNSNKGQVHHAVSSSSSSKRNNYRRTKMKEMEIGCLGPFIILFIALFFVVIYLFESHGLLSSGGYILAAAIISGLVVGLLYFIFDSIFKPSEKDDSETNISEAIQDEELSETKDEDLSEIPNEDIQENPEEESTVDGDVPIVNVSEEEEETNEEPWLSREPQEPYDPKKDLEYYLYPHTDLLMHYDYSLDEDDDQTERNKDQLVYTLRSFDIYVSSIKCTIGPRVTLYEITLAPGVSVRRLYGLEDDIALSMCSSSIRIYPIARNKTIGIVVPNPHPNIVPVERIFGSRQFQETTMELPCAMGLTQTNDVFMFDLATAPHLLIAGSSGQGKSMALHVIITSLLFKKHPGELKFVLMEPNGAEFGIYQSIGRHFLAATIGLPSIITNATDALTTLASLRVEMNARYNLFAKAGARDIREYNDMFKNRWLNPAKGHKYMPRIVVAIDAYNVLAAGHEFEMRQELTQLAEGARAAGIHLIIAVNRPTSDVLSNDIKSHIPTRISFALPESIDSQIILDCNGAEELICPGDMIFKDKKEFQRIQCAYIDTPETQRITSYISNQYSYNDVFPLPEIYGNEYSMNDVDMEHLDPLFADVARLVVETQQGSTSMIQRKFSLGFNRASRLMNQLEKAGIVSKSLGVQPREVLLADINTLEQLLNNL